MSSSGDTEAGRRGRGTHGEERISGQAREVAKEAGTASMTGSVYFTERNRAGHYPVLTLARN